MFEFLQRNFLRLDSRHSTIGFSPEKIKYLLSFTSWLNKKQSIWTHLALKYWPCILVHYFSEQTFQPKITGFSIIFSTNLPR